MRRFKPQEPVSTEIVAGKDYTKRELEAISDQLLRDDAKSELCRDCGKRGTPTGHLEPRVQTVTDTEGNRLVVDFTEYRCSDDHTWFEGEGAMRGIGGDDPILCEEHFHSRKRREIYCAVGTPDPSIASGIYNRTHPAGRKVNSAEQRKRNGASYYR